MGCKPGFPARWLGLRPGAGGARARSLGGRARFQFSELSLATTIAVSGRPRLTPFVGGRLAMLLMTRRFDQDAFPAQFFSTLSPGVVGGAVWRISSDFGLVLRGRVHYLLYNVDENRSLGYWELATAVSYDF